MLHKSRVFVHVFVLIIFASGCSSVNKIAESFNSNSTNVLKENKDYVMERSEAYDVAAFDFKPDAKLINLKLLFTNNGMSEIKIRPRRFEILALDQRKQVMSEKRIADPDKYLLELEREFMDNMRDTRTVWDTQSFFTEAERQSASNSRRLSAFSRDIDWNRLPLELKAFREEREQWQKGYLNPTDLDQNESVEGKIIFEKTPNAAYYQVKIMLDGTEETAIFNLSMERPFEFK